MRKTSRREFIKQTGVGVAGLSLLQNNTWGATKTRSRTEIPPHTGTIVPGVHGYSDQISVAAGEKIKFNISGTVPYQLSIVRLGHDPDSTALDSVVHTFDPSVPTPQAIHPGSYVSVEKNLTGPIKALTLECWVRPYDVTKWSGLITQYDYTNDCGIGLFLNADGGISFYLGDGGKFDSKCLHSTPEKRVRKNQWYHMVATWDGKVKSIWLDGKRVGKWNFDGSVRAGKMSLRLGAYSENGLASNFLDGDLAMTCIYDRALSSQEIQQRLNQEALLPAEKALACWTFAEESGDTIGDASGKSRHGKIINHGTWMIGGPSFNHEVLRFADYDPKKDKRRGHSLRLASDDLYDCRWTTTHEYRIPASARSGLYAGRIEYEWEGKPHLYHVTFVVKKALRVRKAPICVIAATNTWRAYNGTPFAKPVQKLKRVSTTAGMVNSPGDPPAYCFYRRHAAGQGTYQLGTKMPYVGADPYLLYGEPTSYSHLARAERFAQIWLEKSGYEYDLVTDVDLHRDPDLLQGYKAFIINGHSEYWSLPAYAGLEKFFKNGGNVIVLSGNSLFWRVSYNDDCSIIECRKVDAPGEQMKPHERGESWHSQDGKRGGLLREAGYPGWKLIGLETLGWTGTLAYEMFGPYVAGNTDHFLFNTPEKVNLKRGDKFGMRSDGFSLANGHEFDIRLSALSDLQELPSPAGATVPKDPPGKMIHLADGITPWSRGGSAFDYFFRPIRPKSEQGAEMIYWERAEGGKVFNAGSINAGWGMFYDAQFQALMRNVLFHFGVTKMS